MDFTDIFVPGVTFFILSAFGLLLKKFLFKVFREWAKDTKSKLDDLVIKPLKLPVAVWWFLFCVFFSLKVSHLPADIVDILTKLILAVSIVSVTFTFANLAEKLIKFYSKESKYTVRLSSLTQNIAKIAIFTCGTLVLLNSLGITIAPILTALGVGGLAVALALQDTLANLFAGLQITISRQLSIGDYVKLETGQEGYIMDINWRTTNIRTISNNVIIIPNAKLTQAITTNLSLPDKEVEVRIDAGVHYDSDLNKVEKVTAEVARQVMKEVVGALESFEPIVRYQAFGEYSINFTVILKAKEFTAQYLIRHEFIKRLNERYKKEGIIIPFK